MQYVYRTLGTPRAMGWDGCGDLPLTGILGAHILVSGLCVCVCDVFGVCVMCVCGVCGVCVSGEGKEWA